MATGYLTLPDRKRARVEALARGCAELCESLRAYARAQGGRFVLFGSAARGELRFDSDIDILIDFDPEHHSAAWDFVEAEARRLGLPVDISVTAPPHSPFAQKVLATGVLLA